LQPNRFGKETIRNEQETHPHHAGLLLVPLVALAAAFLLKIPVGTVVLADLALLCPLSHLFMLIFMDHEHEQTYQHVQKRVRGAAQSHNDS
jgi:hypothetical protein